MGITFKSSEFRQLLDYVGYDRSFVDTESWLNELESDGYVSQVGRHFKSALIVPSVYPDTVYVMEDLHGFIDEFCDRDKFLANRQNENYWKEN